MKKQIMFLVLVQIFCLTSNSNAQWWLNGLRSEECLDICEHNNQLFVIARNNGTLNIFRSYAADQYEGIWSLIPTLGLASSSYEFIHSTGSSLFVGGHDGLFKSVDNGNNWRRVLNSSVTSMCNSSSALFVTIEHQGVSYSDNEGENWTPKNLGLMNIETTRVISNGQFVFSGSSQGGLWLSSNYGGVWGNANTGLPTDVSIYPMLTSLAISFVTTSGKGIFRSNDLSSWQQIGSNLGTWTDMIGVGQSLYLLGDVTYKFSASSDAGNSWTLRTVGIPELVTIRKGVAFSNFIYVATTEGVWRALQNELTTDIEEAKIISNKFSLCQNYPNPFNPETTISYTIPSNVKGETINVTLKVYDVLGREIATLVDEYKQAGIYNSKFSTQNLELSSGVYFYTLKAGNYAQANKMILAK